MINMLMTIGDTPVQRRVLSYFSIQAFCKICNKCFIINGDCDISILSNHLEKYHDSYLEPDKNKDNTSVNKYEDIVTKLADSYSNRTQQNNAEAVHLSNTPTVIKFRNRRMDSSQEDNINDEWYDAHNNTGDDSDDQYNCKPSKKVKHTCHNCGRTFVCPQKLKAHIKMKHLNVLRYFCPEKSCKKGFFYKSDLEEHHRIHTGDKPFLCTICGKGFSLKWTLQCHIKTHGEKQFQCATCNKGFFTKGDLKRHEIIHRGEKAHVCQECGKRFSQRSQLTNHMRLHTGETPYNCDKCGKHFKMKHHLTGHKCKNLNC